MTPRKAIGGQIGLLAEPYDRLALTQRRNPSP